MAEIIVIVVLLFIPIIGLVIKNQGLSNEVNRFRAVAKHENIQCAKSVAVINDLAEIVQIQLVSQLEANIKSGLVDGQMQEVARSLFGVSQHVIMRCLKYGETPEEALRSCLSTKSLDLSLVTEFVNAFPDEIKFSWVKNNVDGFISTCTKINGHFAGQQVKKSEAETKVSGPGT